MKPSHDSGRLRDPVLVTALLLATAALAPAQTKKKIDDRIRRADGGLLRRVEVLSETLTEVTFKRGSTEKKLATSEVRGIEFRPVPEAYERAVFELGRGEALRAANLFQEAATQSSRAVVKVDAAFRAGRALLLAAATEASQADGAARQLSAWCDAQAEHRRLPEALLLFGRAKLLTGDADGSIAAFGRLGKLAASKDLGPAWSAKAKFGEGEALVTKKDFSKARQAYVAASAMLGRLDLSEDPEGTATAIAAKVGEGECWIAERDYRKAKSFFQSLEAQARANPALLAAARCGRGQALLELGRSKKDHRSLREAQVLFARVSATDTTDSEATAKALCLLGECVLALGKSKEGADYARRAELCFENVVELYGESPWALRARAALKK